MLQLPIIAVESEMANLPNVCMPPMLHDIVHHHQRKTNGMFSDCPKILRWYLEPLHREEHRNAMQPVQRAAEQFEICTIHQIRRLVAWHTSLGTPSRTSSARACVHARCAAGCCENVEAIDIRIKSRSRKNWQVAEILREYIT